MTQANRVYVRTATLGQGTVTLGAVTSQAFCTFAESGVTDGASIESYIIEAGQDFEIGVGVYNAAGPTLTRSTVRLSRINGVVGTTKMTLIGNATVRAIVAAEDMDAKSSIFATKAAVQAATIPASVNALRTDGYYAAGDGGSAIYKAVPDTGTLQAWQFRSNGNTRRWQYVPDGKINVLQLGAVGDDGTDNATAIAAAYGYLVFADGGVMFFPAGKFRYSAFPVILQNGVYIETAGYEITQLRPTYTTGADGIAWGNAASIITKGGISNCTISPTGTMADHALINIDGAASIFIDKVHLLGGFDGINISSHGNQSLAKLSRLTFELQGGSAIVLGRDSTGPSWVNEIFLTDITVSGALTGIHAYYVDGVYAKAVSIYQSLISLMIEPGTGQAVTHMYFDQFIGDSCSQYSVTIRGAGTIGNIYFDKSAFNSNLGGFNIDSSATKLSGLSIANSNIENNQNYGVFMGAGVGIDISNTTIAYNSTASSGGFAGVSIQPGVGHFTITNSKIGTYGFLNPSGTTNKQSWGIVVATGASDYYIITNNLLDGNITGGLSDAGTGTHKTVTGNLP